MADVGGLSGLVAGLLKLCLEKLLSLQLELISDLVLVHTTKGGVSEYNWLPSDLMVGYVRLLESLIWLHHWVDMNLGHHDS